MIDVYVLNSDLNLIGVIDAYKSLIWANRYSSNGDCELYVEANTKNISLLQDGNFLMRADDEMVCRIKKIEIDTSASDGNYLIVTGYDAKSFLDQRIIWNTASWDGSVEDFIRQLVNRSLITPIIPERKLKNSNGDALLQLGTAAGFTEVVTEQVSYKNLGEKIREYCGRYSWGYKFTENNGVFKFFLYKGTDRSNEVVFSDNYENLSSTKYINDKTNIGNVALVGGAGEGASRSRETFGTATGVNRYEQFVDAKDIAKNITWAELTAAFPGGSIASEGSGYVYKMATIDIQIVDENQLEYLEQHYPSGTEITVDGNVYYRVSNLTIADLPTNEPTNDTQVVLREVIYAVYLLNRAAEKLAEFSGKVSFEGSVISNVTFVYKQDYFLGDLVTVENEFDIKATARIIEVVEVLDGSGYRIEPKFQYLEVY